jgi:transposase
MKLPKCFVSVPVFLSVHERSIELFINSSSQEKKTLIATQRSNPKTQEKRKELSEWQQTQIAPLQKTLAQQKQDIHSAEEIIQQQIEQLVGRWIFIDESGSNLDMTRTHARAPKGKRATDHVPKLYGGVITMIGALSLDGMIALMTIEGGTSGDVFLLFVQHVLGPQLRAGDTIFWDNLGAHKDKRVLAELEKMKVTVKFTPPYSPDFNPIEFAWNKIKNWMKKAKARTRAELDEALSWIPDQITRTDILSWLAKCGYLHQPS